MANRYWIGGSGSIGDTAHWSLTSGGVGGASAPIYDNLPTLHDVIFDSNSGSGVIYTSHTSNSLFCNDLTISSTSEWEFQNDGGDGIMYVAGDLVTQSNTHILCQVLFARTDGDIFYNTVCSITSNGSFIPIIFFAAELTLNDDLSTSDFEGVDIGEGITTALYSNNHNIHLSVYDDYTAFYFDGAGDLGTSEITAYRGTVELRGTIDYSHATFHYYAPQNLPSLSINGLLRFYLPSRLPSLIVNGDLHVGQLRYLSSSIELPSLGIGSNIRYNMQSANLENHALSSLTCASYGGGQLIIKSPSVKLYASSSRNYLASVNKQLSMLTLAATAHVNASAWLLSALPPLEVDATGYISGNGYLSKSIARVRLTASAIGGSLSGLSRAITALKVSSSASWTVVSTNTLTLPAVRLYSSATNGDIVAILMNMKNFALTEYTNYNYNSIGFFNGKMVGVKADGVYELTGDTDDGNNIEWNFKTGKLDIDEGVVKKTRYVWLSYKPSGDLQLIVDDGEHEYEYDVESYKQIDNGVRVKLGKGIRNRYLQFELKNIANEKITLDRMRIFLEPTGKNR
jgi:hypothetical protein